MKSSTNIILSKVNRSLRLHLNSVLEEHEAINATVSNLCHFLTHELIYNKKIPLATYIIEDAFTKTYADHNLPTYSQYSDKLPQFKQNLFNALSMLSLYQISGIDIATKKKRTWVPQNESFSIFKSTIDPSTMQTVFLPNINQSTLFKFAVAIHIFDDLEFSEDLIQNDKNANDLVWSAAI